MKFKISKRLLVGVSAFVSLILPVVSMAAIVNCGNPGQPACDFTSLVGMLNGIVQWFLTIAASVAALSFAWAGAQILMNPGNEGKLSDAKEMFRKTIWGLVWLLGSWLIIYTVVKTLAPGTALRFLGV